MFLTNIILGTTDTVFVRFFDKDEFVQPFNKQNSSRSLKPLQNYSADFVFDHMNTSGPWGLDKFAVGPGSIPGGKNFDNLKLKNIWIQDGKITRVYDCDCRVGQNSDRSWVYPDYIKSFTEIVSTEFSEAKIGLTPRMKSATQNSHRPDRLGSQTVGLQTHHTYK